MSAGNFHTFLFSADNQLLKSDAFNLILQILDAMIFLKSKDIVYQNLAAKNCLLRKSSQSNKTIKLCNFENSRDLKNDDNKETNLSYQWLPFEVLSSGPTDSKLKLVSSKGDIYLVIWCFGLGDF
uniref:Protein kinase domain-containing protein n=1 Tax=Panagrolaimus superbus TaxID=310955 RepID=A0A914XXN8_9BILA